MMVPLSRSINYINLQKQNMDIILVYDALQSILDKLDIPKKMGVAVR